MITEKEIRKANKTIAEILGYTHVITTPKFSWGLGLPRRDIVRYFKPHNRLSVSATIEGLDEDSFTYYSWSGVIELLRLTGDKDIVINPYKEFDYYFRKAIELLNQKLKKSRERKTFTTVDNTTE